MVLFVTLKSTRVKSAERPIALEFDPDVWKNSPFSVTQNTGFAKEVGCELHEMGPNILHLFYRGRPIKYYRAPRLLAHAARNKERRKLPTLRNGVYVGIWTLKMSVAVNLLRYALIFTAFNNYFAS